MIASGERTMPTMLDPAVEAEYLALIRAFPLVSIRDDAHLTEALEVIDQLIEQAQRSGAEEAYLGALTDLVETYENTHSAIPSTHGIDAVHYLMDENGLSQAELVSIFGTPSVVSEVLAGKRRLSLTHIRRLAVRFRLPTDVCFEAAS